VTYEPPTDPHYDTLRDTVAWMRDGLGMSHFRIAMILDISLTRVRQLLDPRAAELHEQWRP
jgi:DNA-directed RNA polymerase specialized sigma24 family protein